MKSITAVSLLQWNHSKPSKNWSVSSISKWSWKTPAIFPSKLTVRRVLAAFLLLFLMMTVNHPKCFGQDTTIVYNVLHYGLKGDGVTSDHGSLKALLVSVHNKGGGTIYFPNGTYIIDPGKCRLQIYSNTILEGQSLKAIIKVKDNAGDYSCIFSNDTTTMTNVVVRRLKFDHNPGANRTCNVMLNVSPQVTFLSYQFKNIAFEDCHFVYSGANCIVLSSPRPDHGNVIIRRNTFEYIPGLSTDTKREHLAVWVASKNSSAIDNKFSDQISSKGSY